jgi:hypothetical protein
MCGECLIIDDKLSPWAAAQLKEQLRLLAVGYAGLGDARYLYFHGADCQPYVQRWSNLMCGRPADIFTVDDAGCARFATLLDAGVDGLTAQVRALVEHVLAGRRIRTSQPTTTEESVRQALTDFHNPIALARSDLASGASIEERARSAQGRIRAGIDDAFGPSPRHTTLRRTLEAAYIDDNGGHNRAMYQLGCARTTYFRRLRQATAMLVEQLVPGAESQRA